MFECTGLAVFHLTKNKKELSSAIVDCGIPFTEYHSADLFFSHIKSCPDPAILSLDNPERMGHLLQLYPDLNKFSNLLIVYTDGANPTHSIAKLKQFILSNRRPSPFIQQIIVLELEKLGLSKTYTGFKYLIDYMCYTFHCNNKECYGYDLFNKIAHLHQSLASNVERDIRHMLTNNISQNETFKINIEKLNINNLKINTKNTLLMLSKYICNLL